MSENIKVIEAFNFANVKGDKITLQKGIKTEGGKSLLRYRAFGNNVPFPVSCGSWFCGIPWNAFINSMRNLGYELYAKVEMETGMTKVYPVDFEIQSCAKEAQFRALLHGSEFLHCEGNDKDAQLLYCMANEAAHRTAGPSFEDHMKNLRRKETSFDEIPLSVRAIIFDLLARRFNKEYVVQHAMSFYGDYKKENLIREYINSIKV